MYFSSYRAKTAGKKLASSIVEVLDFSPNHPIRYLRRQAAEDTGRYVAEHMIGAISFYSERDLLRYALSEMPPEGALLEFGVYKGGSTRYIAKTIGPKRELHGFDSFEGLPEAWSGGQMTKGMFDRHGKLPNVPSNCMLHKGWFDATLPKWLETHPDKVAFLHIDCDLYSSTKTVFDLLSDRMIQGTIIEFDEYFNYPNWRNHEHKAFQELVFSRGLSYDYIAYSHSQVVVKLRSNPSR